MNLNIFLILSLICLLSCSHSPPYQSAGYTSIHEHIKIMNQENWSVSFIGGSFYDGDIKKLNVGFDILENDYDVEKVRALLVKGIETFLTSINNNEKLIPYLNHYPFTSQDIEYDISLYTADHQWLGHAFLMKGDLVYYKTHPRTSTYVPSSEKIYEEPYSEALQKVKAGLAIPFSQQSADPI